MRLRILILDMQSELYAKTVRRMLTQELADCNVVIVRTPGETADVCRVMQPQVLLMEVTAYSPWTLPERMKTADRVRREAGGCRIVLVVDDVADRALADAVKRAKQDGLIDAFLYTSATESYLAAVLDSL